MSGFIPEGFVTVGEALARSVREWNIQPADAWLKLRQKLHAGALPSYCSRAGQIVRLSDEAATFRAPFSATVWGSELNDRAYARNQVVFPGPLGSSSYPAMVKADELEAFLSGKPLALPAENNPMPEQTEGSETKDGDNNHRAAGGRPPDYEKLEGFLTAACHLLFNPPHPDVSSELAFRKAILARMGELGLYAPSEPTARSISRRLWKAMQQETK